MKFKKICFMAVAAAVVFTAGCSKKDPLSEPPVNTDSAVAETSETATEAAAEPSQPEGFSGINPLTGESGYKDSANGKRPVAVMVNNLAAALPQYGIEQADIIYELPVEGGITRLMAVYADYTSVPDVCSVRSCRYYYPLLCLGMDAIYCHWGSDQTIALETLNRTGIDHLDGAYDSSIFLRDEARAASYASEHTGYLKGSELPAVIEAKGFRTDRNENNQGLYFNFAPEGEKAAPAEMTADNVIVNFSDAYFSTFQYDEQSGAYLKFHSGNPHVDGVTGNQLSFENVLILQTNVYLRDNGYLLDVELSGGTGYYISNGGAQSITWEKNGESMPIQLYAADGNPLLMNVGESYIGIIGGEKTISIT
ncbi:MAG: DUF3048 domain-containing protein [Oscillospiraceae bacterium]|nr:DUF3048 domain-containing protein [Ruminococcus sp.]MDD6098550.1 DUF3048 domain-containing protein [Oscillospiraceae bacterium]